MLGLVLLPIGQINAQEDSEMLPPVSSPATEAPDDSTAFFSDVLVRGQPVLQVGSLNDISATERAQIINRRIAGLLAQSGPIDPVTVQTDNQRGVATLQVNNRVLMTVTQQDALDFDTTVEKLGSRWADDLNQALQQPNLALDVAQRLDGASRQLVRQTINNLPSLIGAMLVVIATWIVAIAIRRAVRLWARQTEGDRSTEILIERLGYGSVWVLGSVLTLAVLGLNFTTLLGTLGLTSVAIGFSLKDVLSNYISGVVLLSARPFRINDQVVIGEYEGTIVQIQLRATTMQTYDGRTVYIPNQEVFQSSIVNNTASPVRRSSFVVGIDYDADIDEARQLIERAIANIDTIEKQPPAVVIVRELAASTVNLEVWFWINSRRQAFLQVTSEAIQAVKEQLQSAHVEMPTDIYTLMFRNAPPTPDRSKDRSKPDGSSGDGTRDEPAQSNPES